VIRARIVVALLVALVASAAPAVKILPLGDSITFGCGDGCDGNFCDAQHTPCAQCAGGYRAPLWRSITTLQGVNVSFVGSQLNGPADIDRHHEGHSGWKTTDIHNIIGTWAAFEPDLILVHLGTNDIGEQNFSSPANASVTIAARMTALLSDTFTRLPRAHVFLASIIGMPHWCHFYNNPNNLTAQEEAYNALLPGVAMSFGADRVTFVDMKNLSGLCLVDSAGCCPPMLHPNAIGYNLMAGVWGSALARYWGVQSAQAARAR